VAHRGVTCLVFIVEIDWLVERCQDIRGQDCVELLLG
jgi:hypothetical protein